MPLCPAILDADLTRQYCLVWNGFEVDDIHDLGIAVFNPSSLQKTQTVNRALRADTNLSFFYSAPCAPVLSSRVSHSVYEMENRGLASRMVKGENCGVLSSMFKGVGLRTIEGLEIG